VGVDVRHDAEDQEPELGGAGKAPPKKPLAEFLAEFEERLRNNPDEAATGALRVVEERAAGLRRAPAETPATQYAPAPPDPPSSEAAPAAETEASVANPSGSEAASGEAAASTGRAETPAESRRLPGRRRRKHRHRAH
jgi:hypothetical protein